MLHLQFEKACDEIFQEKISGSKDDRSQLNLLISKLRKGDTICVVRLDRLGRRMAKLVELINEFKAKGIEFVALENNIDTTTPIGMLFFIFIKHSKIHNSFHKNHPIVSAK